MIFGLGKTRVYDNEDKDIEADFKSKIFFYTFMKSNIAILKS